MKTTCIVCGDNASPSYRGIFDDRFGHPGLYTAYGCSTCRSYSIEPRLKPDEIIPLYTDYYPRRNIDAGVVKARAASFKPAAVNGYVAGEHHAQRLLPKAAEPGLRVLDIGCGDGSSLLELKALGYEAYGVETDANVARVRDALGLNIHIGMVENARLPAHSFQHIIANQVIEHVVDIDSFIASMRELLAPGGTVIVSTPNARSFFRALYGRRWMHWHVPYHQQIWSARGLSIALERNGLKLDRVQTMNPPSWTMHELNRLRFKAEPGKKNPFWTDPSSISSGLIGKIARRTASIALQAIGRVASLCGHGNCLIIWAKAVPDA